MILRIFELPLFPFKQKLVDILEQAANEGLLDYAIIDNVLRPEDY